MIRPLVSLVAALGLGASIVGCSCGSAHEIEDAATNDAGTDAVVASDAGSDAFAPVDAFGATERYFTLEQALVDLFVTPERCSVNEGSTAMLRVTVHVFSTCDSPGPIDATVDPASRTITIVPHVWRENGRTDCTTIGAAFERDVAIDDVVAGTWTLVAGSSATTLVVEAPLTTSCPPLGMGTYPAHVMCEADCQCLPGLACLAIRGDAACAHLCADPCEALGIGRDLSLSCAGGEACTNDGTLGWICEPSAADECGSACPAGMTCPPVTEGPPQCVWAVSLNGAIRHECTTESDCDAGLDCVQRADGQRRCEVRCTTSDMACPSDVPHECMAGNWVCEWLGE